MTHSLAVTSKLSLVLTLLAIGLLSGCGRVEVAKSADAGSDAPATGPATSPPPTPSPTPTPTPAPTPTPTPTPPPPAPPPPAPPPPVPPPAPPPPAPPPPPPPPITIAVGPAAATIPTQQTQQFTATLQNTTNVAVIWQVDGIQNGSATVGAISASGLYTAPALAGTHSIKATSVADSTKSASATVQVTAISVTISPASATIATDKTQQFTAQVSNTTNTAVTWGVDGVQGGNANVGVISAAGLYTPPKQAGTHSVTATSVADPTKSASANVKVTDAGVTVTVTPANASITTAQTQQFTANVANATNTAVTWAVDTVQGGNANVGTISTGGLYSPPTQAGTHSITATSVADPTKSGTASVNVVVPPPSNAVSGVLTYHNDNARTGQNLQESVLTPSNVNVQTFGRLFSAPLDGDVYAQPLYVSQVTIAGALHNVVFVVTEHDSVYAFDADKTGGPLWQRSFIDPAKGITTVPSSDTGCGDIVPEIGITSTPVIDPGTGVLYVVAKTKENGVAKYRLHALDITTGLDKIGTGVDVQASVPGSAKPNDGLGHVVFTPQLENQRLALLLNNGVVYFGTGSYCDLGDHHGWMFAYDAASLNQVDAFTTTPNGTEGGAWQAGGGAAADADGNVYLVTADGTFDASSGGKNYGNTYLKFAGGSFAIVDYFTPFNQANLEAVNSDLGSSGALLLPDQPAGPAHLLVGGGKQGVVYVLNRDNMGKFQAGSDSQIVQSFPSGTCGPGFCSMFGTPAYFNGTVYTAGVNDGLKAYAIVAGKLNFAARSTNDYKWPGSTPAISANGSDNGIVWTVERNGPSGAAILHAHNASNVATELYNSNQNAPRDALAPAKFAVPTVANGKVYVSAQGQLSVYGLLN